MLVYSINDTFLLLLFLSCSETLLRMYGCTNINIESKFRDHLFIFYRAVFISYSSIDAGSNNNNSTKVKIAECSLSLHTQQTENSIYSYHVFITSHLCTERKVVRYITTLTITTFEVKHVI